MSETNIDLMRHLLGSVDLSDLDIVDVAKPEEMSEIDRKEYVAAISSVFPRLEKDIKRAMMQQLLLTFSTADNMDKVALGQGTFNGMSLLLNFWRKAHQEHVGEGIPEEEGDKNSPINEL